MQKEGQKERIICIGAGASGLFFALNCADEDHEVILFDSNSKPGRKMYITGKGRCNITNDCDTRTFINNVVSNPRFLYSAINRFGPADTIAFFNEHGCPVKTERGSRVFPVSDKSADIIDCLVRECRKRKVGFHFSEKVKQILKKDDHFMVVTDKNNYEADKVVIATGGRSYPSTGSTGDGYYFAQSFGHQIIDPRSALCPLMIKEPINKELLKLTLKNVSLCAHGPGFDRTIFGDLEFVEGAISGPIALTMSSLINRLQDIRLELDLKPALDEEKLDKRILRDIEKSPNRDLEYLLRQLLPGEFLPFFLQISGLDKGLVLNVLTRESRHKLLSCLKKLPLSYAGLAPIDKGIITAGGVSIKEVDPKTFESKLCPGLYLIGEVLDVDAFTGGFNLQIALATGYSCALGIRE